MPTSPIAAYLQHLHTRFAACDEGEVASYIPELAKADPDWFGICVVTTDGHLYTAGDIAQPFTIQSISKPLVFGLALEHLGVNTVQAKVGVEPTGDAFNSISLDPATGRPANPMINAGAIATTGLIPGTTAEAKIADILAGLRGYVDHDLGIDDTVYRSEADTGHRNRAIAHLLKNFAMIEGDPEPAVDAYFRQCSILVDCRDLALIAGTLANNGVNPLTKARVLQEPNVERVLSLMMSCGMYNFAGEWTYRVGLPAKSGVAGGIIAVLPGRLGIGIFSPRLDALGNSVRGIKVCEEMTRAFDLHTLRVTADNTAVIRKRYDGTTVNSRRVRTIEESRLLRQHGGQIVVVELQGPLTFATAEVVVRTVLAEPETAGYRILDLRHVTSIDGPTCQLFHQLWQELRAEQRDLIFARGGHLPRLGEYLASLPQDGEQARTADDLDALLEWCENRICNHHATARLSEQVLPIERFPLLRSLDDGDFAALKPLLRPISARAGDVITRPGDPSNELYFLARGKVSVLIENTEGKKVRVGTFSSGMVFGEMAFLDGSPRSALTRADTAIDGFILSRDRFAGITRPSLTIGLLGGIAQEITRTLRRTNEEVRTFRE